MKRQNSILINVHWIMLCMVGRVLLYHAVTSYAWDVNLRLVQVCLFGVWEKCIGKERNTLVEIRSIDVEC